MDDSRPELSAYERPCPLAFVVLALIASAVLWLCALLTTLPLR